MIYFANIRRSGGMVDTKDSKSFVSDGVRVQVSSPVYERRNENFQLPNVAYVRLTFAEQMLFGSFFI